MNIIEVVIGDWSGDGHNIRQSFIAISNRTSDEINACLLTANAQLGGGIFETVGENLKFRFCQEYEDGEIPWPIYEKLLVVCPSLVLDPEDPDFDEFDEPNFLYSDKMFALWMDLARYGSTLNGMDLKIEKAESAQMRIGGYGLFSN